MKNFQDIFKQTLSFYVKNAHIFFRVGFMFLLPWILLDAFVWNNEELTRKLILKNAEFYYFLNSFFDVLSVFCFFFFTVWVIKLILVIERGEDLELRVFLVSIMDSFKNYTWIKFLYAAKILLWGLLLVVPGIFAAINYSLAGYAHLLDGKKGKEALQFSKELIKPKIFKFTDYVLLICLIVGGVCAALVFTFDPIINFYRLHGEILMANLINYLEWYIVLMGVVFLLIFLYYLYGELKAAKNYQGVS